MASTAASLNPWYRQQGPVASMDASIHPWYRQQCPMASKDVSPHLWHHTTTLTAFNNLRRKTMSRNPQGINMSILSFYTKWVLTGASLSRVTLCRIIEGLKTHRTTLFDRFKH